MEKYKFSTQITVMDMYRYQMRHAYICPSGFISILISLICLLLVFLNHENYVYTTNVLLVLGAALFTIIQPFMILRKSMKIIAFTPTFSKPLEYELDEEGVHVSQDEETADLKWDNVIKAIETRTTLCIYSSPKNGFILPKKQLGDECENIKNYIKNNVKDYGIVKIK